MFRASIDSKEVEKWIDQSGKRLAPELRKALSKSAAFAKKELTGQLPRKSGALKKSLKTYTSKDRMAKIVKSKPVAKGVQNRPAIALNVLEFGAKAHKIPGGKRSTKNTVILKLGGNIIVATRQNPINHPGVTATKPVTRVMPKVERNHEKVILEALEAAVK